MLTLNKRDSKGNTLSGESIFPDEVEASIKSGLVSRDKRTDLLRGILILLVVIAHYQRDLTHDIIFLFHMPCFFALSGVWLQKDKLLSEGYLRKKIHRMMLPYLIYLLIDFVLFKRTFDVLSIIKMLWGGRVYDGVYWYITCFIGALILFKLYLRNFNERTTCAFIIAGGVSR